MSYQVLARKWRPASFAQMVGQAHVVRPLSNALEQQRLHHAYLFTGTRGVGKTTLARIFAKCLNCESGITSSPCEDCGACTEISEGRFVDLVEVDAASRTKVEDTRELLDNVQYAPTRGRFKVYLIDEVHMLSGHSFNALLKTLEEPPPHVKFLLATTDPQKLPVTVLSRCLQFNLKRMLPDQVEEYLGRVLTEEAIPFEPPALANLARAADGSMRDALSLLDQAIAYGAGSVREHDVNELLGTVSRELINELVSALAKGDAVRVIKAAAGFAEQAMDFSEVLTVVLGILHRAALAQSVPELADESDTDHDLIRMLSQALTAETLQLYYQMALMGRKDLEITPNPKSGFEMIMLRMLGFAPACASQTPSGDDTKVKSADDSTPAVQTNDITESSSQTASAVSENSRLKLNAGNWPVLIDNLALRGIAHALASNCSYKALESNSLTLTLHPSHEQLRTGSSEKRLQEAISKYYSQDIGLHIDINDHSSDTLAQINAREQLARQREAEQSIETDDVVQALKTQFGAQVIPGSIKPISNS